MNARKSVRYALSIIHAFVFQRRIRTCVRSSEEKTMRRAKIGRAIEARQTEKKMKINSSYEH